MATTISNPSALRDELVGAGNLTQDKHTESDSTTLPHTVDSLEQALDDTEQSLKGEKEGLKVESAGLKVESDASKDEIDGEDECNKSASESIKESMIKLAHLAQVSKAEIRELDSLETLDPSQEEKRWLLASHLFAYESFMLARVLGSLLSQATRPQRFDNKEEDEARQKDGDSKKAL
ncbi:hypothetical protein F5144DRAFT_607261 [Chaetomium tenue]|uniref:Uncharacterized protein n=1 Tax=Chaetomium tenue TaxID=1854479 RepID=A0ACB7NXM9_9PEZI|nr:hypothetical protein F5144DRAFT_607261 [Chaetomium globosum]